MIRSLLLLGCLLLASPLAAQPISGSALEQFRLPAEGVTFIENRGQWPDEVAFLARLDGVDVWVTATGLIYDFYERGAVSPSLSGPSTEGGWGRVVEARFVGGRAARVEGHGPQPTYHNYLFGNDPSQWATRVPIYSEVILQDLYDDVSLRLYEDGGVLQQELVLGPAADPSAVRVEIEGGEGLDLSAAGVLDRATVLGIAEPLPGSPLRSGLQGAEGFGAQGGGMRLRYARFLGGTAEDYVRAIALDASGSAYFGGRTKSANFPTPNGYDQERQGGEDAYLAQVGPDGSQVYGTYIGGSREDEVRGVAYANASVYLTGVTSSPNFPTTPGAYEEEGSDQGEEDAFVMRLRTDGTGPVFSTFLGGGEGDDVDGDGNSLGGGGGDDAGAAIAVRATGAVVVGGRTEAEDFPVPNGSYDNRGDAFVVVLSGDGTAVQGGTFLGGNQLDEIRALELGNGSIYVAGDTRSGNFEGLDGGFRGGVDAFVARLSASGNAILGGTYIGGSGLEGATGNGGNDRTGAISMTLGADGTVYVSGDTASDDFPATFSIGPLGQVDAFVTRLEADATTSVGSTVIGGSGIDRARGIALGPDGTIHLAGETASGNFPVQGADDATYNQLGDAFIAQLTGDGAEVVYATYLGGSDVDAAFDIAVGEDGLTYVVGETRSGTNFPVSPVSPPYQGVGDVFIASYDLGPNASPVVVNPIADITLSVVTPQFTAGLAGVFEDPDGDVLTYTCASSAPGVASVSDCADGVLTVTAVDPGEATITVTATDPVGGNATDAFVVTVENLPPVVVATPEDAVLALDDDPLVIDLTQVFDDPEDEALAYTCQLSVPGVATVSACFSGTLTVTPIGVGTVTITLTASDTVNPNVSTDFTVTVALGNVPPVVESPIPDADLVLGDAPLVVELAPVFDDPNGDTLTYACSSSAPGVASVSGCLSGTLTVTVGGVGTATVTVTASDPDGASVADAFVVTVTNPPPVVSTPIPDAALALGDDPLVVGLASVFTDPNGDTLTYTCQSSAPGVASVGDCSDGTLSVTAAAVGSATVTVTASDGSASVSDVFAVTVTNPPPVVVSPIPDFPLLLGGDPFTVDLDTVFADPNGDALAYSFAVDGAAVQLSLDGGVLVVSPAALGAATVTVTASDGAGSASEAFVVTVTDNLPPVVLDPPGDATLVVGEGPLVLDVAAVFEDPEGDALTFACQSSAPSVASVGDCGGGVLTVTAVGAGVATITITASDGSNSTSAPFTVTVVLDNAPPTVVNPLADATLAVDDAPLSVALAPVFNDPDGDALIYTCSSSAPGVASVSGCPSGTLTVTPETEGTATITVTARDPDGASTEDAFVVTIGSNAAPIVTNPIADVAFALGDAPLVVDLDVVFADPEGGELVYACQSSAPGVAAVSGCAEGMLTVTPQAEGAATITVTATDPAGAGTTESFAATVGCAPASITTVTPSPAEPERGADVAITAMVAGGQSATLRFRQGGAESYVAVAMMRIGNRFTATIPGVSVTERGVDYVVEVRSACGSVSQSAPRSLRVRVPAGVTSPVLPASTALGGYRLVSVPLTLEDAGAPVVLDDFGAAGEGWQVLDLLPPGVTGDQRAAGTDDQWYRDDASAISLVPGSAYWLIVRGGGRFTTGAGATVSRGEPFGVDLHRGWNLVGSPFGYEVPLDHIRMESGAPLQLQAYGGAWRNETAAMDPFQGYALYADAEDRLIVEPSVEVGPRPGARTEEAPQADKAERAWAIDITAEIGEARDDNNTALVMPGATDGRDAADWVEPPLVGAYVSVAFAASADGGLPLTIDARPISEDGASWPVRVRSNIEGRVALSFDGLDSVPADHVVWLVDEAAASVHDLRRSPSYSVSSQGNGTAAQMKLVVGTPAYAQATSGFDGTTPSDYALEPSYPNPFRSVSTIQYALPSAEHVTLEVFDIVGRRVATLVDGEMEAGYHRVVWVGRGMAGQADLASGVYIYRLRAGTFTATQRAVLVR